MSKYTYSWSHCQSSLLPYSGLIPFHAIFHALEMVATSTVSAPRSSCSSILNRSGFFFLYVVLSYQKYTTLYKTRYNAQRQSPACLMSTMSDLGSSLRTRLRQGLQRGRLQSPRQCLFHLDDNVYRIGPVIVRSQAHCAAIEL